MNPNGTHQQPAQLDDEKCVAQLTSHEGGQINKPLEQGSFSTFGAVTLAVCVINTWIAMLVALDAGLRAGGPISLVWGLLYTIVCTYCTVLSHSEMFAVLPTAAGQYAWAFLVSPPRWRADVCWLTGMANIAGVWLDGAGAAYLCTRMLLAVIQLNVPSFAVTPGRSYALFASMVILCPMSSMLIGNRANRIVEWIMLRLAVLAALAIVVTLLTVTKQKASAAFVFGGTTLAPGYSSLVISFLIGILPCQYSFCGFDIVYHISEEIRHPARNGPTAAKLVILIAGSIAWFVLVCVLFCIPDVGVAQSDEFGFAFARIVLASTGSRACASVFVLAMLVVFTNAVRGMAMNAARILLAFGRDGMIPFAGTWMHVTKRSGEPVYGILCTIGVHLVLGLVMLAPDAAFSSLLGSSVIFTFVAYSIPCLAMLMGGRARLNQIEPDRLHNLGPILGPICNLVACFFTLQAIIIYCFPTSLPVTVDNLNYVVVFVSAFAAIMAIVYFGFARRSFKGPKALLNHPHITQQALRIGGEDKRGVATVGA